jgi:hypothetical protein
MAKKAYKEPRTWAEVDLATEVAEAKRRFEAELKNLDLTSCTARPVVKIKPMKRARGNHAESIAVYRSGTAIFGNPIFWISDRFVETAMEFDGLSPSDVVGCLLDTICHEYGHALCDLLRLGDRRNGTDNYRRLVLARYRRDEEVFAEEFGAVLAGRSGSAYVFDTIEAIKKILGDSD